MKIVLFFFLRKLLIEDFLLFLNVVYVFFWLKRNLIFFLILFINLIILRKKVELCDWFLGLN